MCLHPMAMRRITVLPFLEGVEIDVLQVFDRWGELVWQGNNLAPNDVDAGWDGRLGSRALMPGVFVWQAVLVFPDGETEVFSGDVTIVR
jgi:large repetitive protein